MDVMSLRAGGLCSSLFYRVAGILLLTTLLPGATQATTRFVSAGGGHLPPFTNWVGAATNIQDAIDVAVAGDTVIVSNGVYAVGARTAPGSLLANRVVIDKAIRVHSLNGPEVTTIHGAWNPGTTNGNAAVRCVWMSAGASLEGFTLTGGATRAEGVLNSEQSGGGLWAESDGAIVRDCILAGNVASWRGGGSWGGTVEQCLYRENQSRFGGGASFFGNPGTLRRCVLINNTATADGGNGGGVFDGVLSNCLLVGNHASVDGGGAYLSVLNNCTVAGNGAGRLGGGVFQSALTNCIVYLNDPGGNWAVAVSFNHTCTTPLPAGVGTIDLPPLFEDALHGDYTLSAGSPCRDTGLNAGAALPLDLAGNPRIVHPLVDMGAYEYPGSPPGDYDGDGMPNWWEMVHELDPFVASPPDSDADEDSFTDLEEYLADTHPRDAGSFPPPLRKQAPSPGATMTLLVNPTSTGRLYSVQRSGVPGVRPEAWVLDSAETPGTGGALTFTVTNNLPPARFYRSSVRVP